MKSVKNVWLLVFGAIAIASFATTIQQKQEIKTLQEEKQSLLIEKNKTFDEVLSENLPEPKYNTEVSPTEVYPSDFASRYVWKNNEFVVLTNDEFERSFVRIEEQANDLWSLSKQYEKLLLNCQL